MGRLASLLRIMLTPSSATFLSFYLEIVTVGLARLTSDQVFTVYTITFLPGDCDSWVGRAGQVYTVYTNSPNKNNASQQTKSSHKTLLLLKL